MQATVPQLGGRVLRAGLQRRLYRDVLGGARVPARTWEMDFGGLWTRSRSHQQSELRPPFRVPPRAAFASAPR